MHSAISCTSLSSPKGRHFVVLVLATTLIACQPSSEERLASATAYVAQTNYSSAVIELKNALQLEPGNHVARSMLAKVSYQLADFETAEIEFTRALELGAEPKDNWIGLGRTLLRQGRADEALERVFPNLRSDTTDQEELALLGDLFAALGNTDDASVYYNRLLAQSPTSVDGLIGQSIVAAERNDADLARQLLLTNVRENPDSTKAWRILGNFNQMQGQNREAEESFQKSLALETGLTPTADRFETRLSLVNLAIDGQDVEKSDVALSQLREVFPGHPLLHYLSGRISFIRGDVEEAVISLQEYISTNPQDLRGHAAIGAVSFQQNYYRQAEMYLEQAVRGNVGGEVARRLLAETQLKLNKPEDALGVLRDSDQMESTDTALLSLLGRAELEAGNEVAALGYFQRGVQLDPDDSRMKIALAAAQMAGGQIQSAIEMLAALPNENDDWFRKEILLISAYLRNGDTALAISAAEQMLQENPDNAQAYALAGALHQGLGDYEKAKGYLSNSISLDASNQIALYGLATLAKLNADDESVENYLESLLDIQPAHLPALRLLGEHLFQRSKLDEFDTRLDSAIRSNPDIAGPTLLQVRLSLAKQDNEAALDLVRAAKEKFPENSEVRFLEGVALVQLGQMETALISLSSAVAADPQNAQYSFELAAAQLQTNDFYAANETINVYRSLRPESALGLSLKTSALVGLRRFDDARSQIEEFARANPGVLATTVLLGDVELAAGQAKLAVAHFEQAAAVEWNRGMAIRLSTAYLSAGSELAPEPLARWLAENPNDSEIRRSYGQVLQSIGESEAASNEYEILVNENTNDPVALNNLAWEYSLQGRPEALEFAKRAYELLPDNGSIVDTYAWILNRAGKSDEALPLLRRATVLSPSNDEIKFHLASVLASIGSRDEARNILANLLSENRQFPSRNEAEQLAERL